MKGKLLVFEGLDSSGKATQSKLLEERLRKEGMEAERLSFPRYNEFFGSLVGKYLRGEFGKKEVVPAELVSMLYALDRYNEKKSIEEKLSSGKILILDRYSQSNLAYQGAKIPEPERNAFLKWVKELESRLPEPNAVFFMDMPVSLIEELLLGKDRVKEYRGGAAKDVHESDLKFLKTVREVYLELGKKEKNWFTIECVDGGKKLKSREEIHQAVWEKAKKLLG